MENDTATRLSQLTEALEEQGETLDDVEEFLWQTCHGDPSWGSKGDTTVYRSQLTAFIPDREFDRGYGVTEGEPLIAFTKNYVYVCVQYDGAEWMDAIPRHPDVVGKSIPWPGS